MFGLGIEMFFRSMPAFSFRVPMVFHIDTGVSYIFRECRTTPSGRLGFQLLPDAHDQVFDGTKFALHKIHVHVQVLMIQLFNDKFLDDPAEFFDIVHKAGIGVWPAFDGDMQFKVVPMPVFIGTFAKKRLRFVHGSRPGYKAYGQR